jgi:hypothetical protein
MKTKQELLQMLFSKLAKLQNLNKKGFTTKTVWETANFTAKLQAAAHLPEDYTVGTYTRDENFWYKVVEV